MYIVGTFQQCCVSSMGYHWVAVYGAKYTINKALLLLLSEGNGCNLLFFGLQSCNIFKRKLTFLVLYSMAMSNVTLITPSNSEATFVQGPKIFENHLNPVMLVFIGKLSLSTVRWVPMWSLHSETGKKVAGPAESGSKSLSDWQEKKLKVHLCYVFFRVEEDCYLYGVFDGHGGSKASNFAAQRMPAELLLGQLSGKVEDDAVKEVIHQVCKGNFCYIYFRDWQH